MSIRHKVLGTEKEATFSSLNSKYPSVKKEGSTTSVIVLLFVGVLYMQSMVLVNTQIGNFGKSLNSRKTITVYMPAQYPGKTAIVKNKAIPSLIVLWSYRGHILMKI